MRILAAVAVLWSAAAMAQVTPSLCPIEGTGYPAPPFIGSTFHNCQPASTNDAFSQCIARIRMPDESTGGGVVTDSACRYSDGDVLPGLPPGLWLWAIGTCDPGEAAVCTRWQISFRLGGGDAGCDGAGLMCAADPMTPMVRRPALLSLLRCRVGKHAMQCWDEQAKSTGPVKE